MHLKGVLRSQRGAITVFFSIIIFVLILLTGVIVDGARIKTSQAIVQETTNRALYSTLANYNQTLKEDYGLFALALAPDEIDVLVRSYLEDNLVQENIQGLSPLGAQAWDLYNFSIEELEATAYHALGENGILEHQIMEYMKYRAPQELIQEGLRILHEFEQVGKAAKTLEGKMRIERKLEQLAREQKKLEEATERLRKFRPKEVIASFRSLESLAQEREDLSERIEALRDELDEVRSLRRNASTPEEREAIQGEIEGIQEEINDLRDQLREVERDYREQLEEISKEVADALEATREIASGAREMERKMQGIQGEIDAQLSSQEETPEDSALRQELESYQGYLQGLGLPQLIEKGEKNVEVFYHANRIVNKIINALDTYGAGGKEILAGLYGDLEREFSGLDLTLTYQVPPVEAGKGDREGRKDERKEALEKAEEFFKKKETDKDIKIADDKYAQLPSQGKGQGTTETPMEFEEGKAEGGYSEKTLESLHSQSILGRFSPLALRNQLYLNEYILGTFKHFLSDKEPMHLNLRNDRKNDRTTFFDYEVEYVIYGGASQEENLGKSKRDLVGVRFVVNLIYVNRNASYRQSADAIATVLAIPLGAAAKPMIKSLILAGWAMVYAIEDCTALMEGQAVPLYRNREEIKFYYKDYLRLFLLRPWLDQEDKLYRIQDLIQLNLEKNPTYPDQVDLRRYYTAIGVEGTYSVKTLFMKSLQGEGISLDRYRSKILQHQGY